MIFQRHERRTKHGEKQVMLLTTYEELQLLDEALRLMRPGLPVTDGTRPTLHRLKSMRHDIITAKRRLEDEI